jgi:uncharacterized protein (TIGR03067 family)
MNNTRQFIAVSLIVSITGCMSAYTKADQRDISGTWELVSIYENSEEKTIDGRNRLIITFANGKYEAFDGRRVGSFGEYVTMPGENYLQIDLVHQENVVKGIFAIEKNTLRIYKYKTRPDIRPENMNRTRDIVIQTLRRTKGESNKSL